MSDIRDFFDYDPDTGEFIRTVSVASNARAGTIPGTITADGYRRIRFKGRNYSGHRMAWFFVHGRWPEQLIDHINGKRDDNRIANLREASVAENSHNARPMVGTTSRLKGVSWHKHSRRWRAQIKVNMRKIHLGVFDAEDSAHAAYIAAAKRYFGDFARTE